MKKAQEYSQNNQLDVVQNHLDDNKLSPLIRSRILEQRKNNQRACPSCNMETIFGMPGGRDATCTNCGYKDPCCYD